MSAALMHLAATTLGAAAGTICGILLLLRLRHLFPVDLPNWRSLHISATPRSGGIGIALGLCAAFALSRPLGDEIADPDIIRALGCAGLLMLVSLRDDWRPLPISWRLAAQAGANIVFLWFFDLRFALPLALALLWMTNLYNFMDGADGLAGGMAFVGFGTYAWIAYSQIPELALVCAALAGAAAGFLVFNFSPARLFLGDCGSIPLGFLAGALGLIGWHAGAWPAWFPIWVFLPFIADATLTLLGRVLRGEKFWLPHHDHCYQRLARMGWSHRNVSLAYYVLMFSGAISASLSIDASPSLLSGLMTFSVTAHLCLFAWVTLKWLRHPSRSQVVQTSR